MSITRRLFGIVAVAALLTATLLTRPSALPANAASLCGTPGYGSGGIPVVDSVSPNTGSTSGLNSVIVTGCGFTGFTGVALVWFGTDVSRTSLVNSGTQITATAPPHSAGAVDVTVTTPLGTSPTQAGDQYTYVAPDQCTSVTLAGGGSVAPGALVTYTANATCKNPNPLYAFFIRPFNAVAWTSIQGYSTNNVIQWDSRTSTFVSVWAKDSLSSTATFDQTAVSSYDLGGADTPCSNVTLSATPQSPQNQGTLVTLTPHVTGCANPQYLFWIREAWNSNWQALAPGQPIPGFPGIPAYPVYSTSSTFALDTTGVGLGLFYLGVWAKSATSSGSFDSSASIPFTLGFCSASISASPASARSGTQVMFTASSSGCSVGGGSLYEFWMRPASQSRWQLVQAYSPNTQYQWNSAGAAAGVVYFAVWVKDNPGSPEPYDAFTSIPFQVT